MTGGDLDLACHHDRRPAAAGVACLSWKAVAGSGSLVGFAELHIAAFRLRLTGCAAFASRSNRWVALPARQIAGRDGQPLRDENGKARWQPLVSFDDAEMQRRFSDAAVAAIEAYAPGTFDGGRR